MNKTNIIKILIMAHNPLYPIGTHKPHGGEFSTKEIAEFLVKNNIDVTVLQFHSNEEKREINGVHYITVAGDRFRVSEEHVKNKNYDLIFTWGREVLIARFLKEKYKIPYAFFVRRFQTIVRRDKLGLLRFNILELFRRGILNKFINLFFKLVFSLRKSLGLSSKLEKAFMFADLIFSNSFYTQKVVKEFYKTDSVVIYPTVIADKYKVEASGSFITTIGKGRRSGHDLVEKLAKNMPNEKFLSVGHYRPSIYPNLKVINEYIDDPREIYRETKIMLCARKTPEPFGRVPVEAGLSGIPSVGSSTGGLTESISQGGILLDSGASLKSWIKALNKVQKEYDEYSKKAEKHAVEICSEDGLNKVYSSLLSILH